MHHLADEWRWRVQTQWASRPSRRVPTLLRPSGQPRAGGFVALLEADQVGRDGADALQLRKGGGAGHGSHCVWHSLITLCKATLITSHCEGRGLASHLFPPSQWT